jgi:hypothetical protein
MLLIYIFVREGYQEVYRCHPHTLFHKINTSKTNVVLHSLHIKVFSLKRFESKGSNYFLGQGIPLTNYFIDTKAKCHHLKKVTGSSHTIPQSSHNNINFAASISLCRNSQPCSSTKFSVLSLQPKSIYFDHKKILN